MKSCAMPLIAITGTLLLAGCAGSRTDSAYQPADYRGDIGYTEQKLTDTQYKITFTADSSTHQQDVQDYALLRAAELTMLKGHDWFMLLDSDTQQSTKRIATVEHDISGETVVRECGLMGCSTYVTPAYTGQHLVTRDIAGNISTTLSISMGDGKPDQPNRVFNAAELADNLRDHMRKDS